MTARALLERLTAEGVTVRLDGADVCLAAVPPRTIDQSVVAEIRALKAEVVEELQRRAVAAEGEAASLLDEARAAGLELTVECSDGLRVRHRTNASPDETLVARIAEHKAAVIAELQRQANLLKYAAGRLGFVADAPATIVTPTLSQRGMMCRVCHRVDRCYADVEGVICPACAEWEVRGCPGFAVLTTADTELEMNCGACLRCGASWSMHGNPNADSWTRYADLDDVVPAATRFVLARAREIARGTRQ